MPMIETKEAVERIDDILDVPGIDVAFVGPVDLRRVPSACRRGWITKRSASATASDSTRDVPAATDSDIVVAYFPDYCQDEVATALPLESPAPRQLQRSASTRSC